MGIASAFVARSAHVILTGRNRDKLAAAVKDLGDAARSISHFRIAAARQIRRATPASPNVSLLSSVVLGGSPGNEKIADLDLNRLVVLVQRCRPQLDGSLICPGF